MQTNDFHVINRWWKFFQKVPAWGADCVGEKTKPLFISSLRLPVLPGPSFILYILLNIFDTALLSLDEHIVWNTDESEAAIQNLKCYRARKKQWHYLLTELMIKYYEMQ